MNLTEITLAKINELGIKPAAEYFGVKDATIRNWMNTKKVPASAAQKVMEESQGPDKTASEIAATPLAVTPERIANIELRLALLESRVLSPTGPTVVPPQPPKNWTAPHNFSK